LIEGKAVHLVLDIGDVLIYTDRNAQYHSLAILTGWPVLQIIDFFEIQQIPLLHEQGKIGCQELYGLFSKQFDANLSYSQFATAWNSVIQKPNYGLLRKIQELSEDYPITLASNIGEIHWNQAKKTLDEWLTDYRSFLSYQVGCRKPHARFFERLLDVLDCDAVDVWYVDDLERNVEQALLLGMNGFVHHSTSDTIRFLRSDL
jgi:putative hydrolase of the HAD superfamily